MFMDNNGNFTPLAWVVTAAALFGAIMFSGKGGGGRGGKGQDGVYIERSQSPCPTGRPCPKDQRRQGRGEEASYDGGEGGGYDGDN